MCLGLAVISSGPAGASALPDPAAAKAADKCQVAINKASAKFASQTLKYHEKCYDAVFKCVQTKPGDQKCIDKAAAKCTKEVQIKRPKNEAKLLGAIQKKCTSFADLMSDDGLGYNALAATCTDAGFPLSGVNAIAGCVRELSECHAERMFGAQMPRARGFAIQEPITIRLGTCLQGTGLGDVGDPKGLGKALDKCQKQVKKASAKFVAGKRKSLQKCVGALFKCTQTKPNDPACIAKAQAKCDKEFVTNIPKLEAKLAAALGKRCLAVFPALLPVSAMNVSVLGAICQQLGIPAFATMGDYAQCIVRRNECEVDDLFGATAPRADALLQTVGHTLHRGVCGPTPTPTATPTSTATVTPSVTATPATTPSFTPAPGQFAVIVNKKGAGTGTVTSIPAGIDCGSTCGASFPVSTAVKLEARTTNGSNAQFNHWGGASCTGPFWDCDVVTDQTHVVDATFGALDHNLVFASSTTVAMNLGLADPNDPTSPYDDACNQLATAAGVNNGGGDAYVAFLSSSVSSALTRLGSARGFILPDGKVFGDLPADMTAQREVFNPLLYDEMGGFDFSSTFATGMNLSGTTSLSTCLDWSSIDSNDFFSRGTHRTGPGFTFVGSVRCDSPVARVFCWMNTQTTPIVPPPKNGKVLYLTDTHLAIGVDDPDGKCEVDKPAGTGTVKALLATTTVAASTHLDDNTTYVRPDGYVIGTGAQLVTVAQAPSALDPWLDSGVWQLGNGSYLTGTAWTGQENIDDLGTVASTCNDWTDTGGTGHRGIAGAIEVGWWNVDPIACSANGRIYCAEQ